MAEKDEQSKTRKPSRRKRHDTSLQPGRERRSTEMGPPLEHLRKEAQKEAAASRDGPPPIPNPPTLPSATARKTAVATAQPGQSTPPADPSPAKQPDELPDDSATRGPNDSDRTIIYIAAGAGIFLLGSCCVFGAIVALWLAVAV